MKLAAIDIETAALAAGGGGQAQLSFSARQFDRVRQLIGRLAGISVADFMQAPVHGRLLRRAREKGLNCLDQYLDLVERSDASEQDAFINALTANRTAFFDQPRQFSVLAEHARARSSDRSFRVWCVGCASGEEAYSIAISLLEALPPGRNFEVLASDVNTEALEFARNGIYPPLRLRGLSTRHVKDFFRPAAGGLSMQASPQLSARVRFNRLNLLDACWPLGDRFDAIFCRNLLSYFDLQIQRRLLERFHPLLRDEGLFACGEGESLDAGAGLFRSLGQSMHAAASADACVPIA